MFFSNLKAEFPEGRGVWRGRETESSDNRRSLERGVRGETQTQTPFPREFKGGFKPSFKGGFKGGFKPPFKGGFKGGFKPGGKGGLTLSFVLPPPLSKVSPGV